jgi:hypothetical protein
MERKDKEEVRKFLRGDPEIREKEEMIIRALLSLGLILEKVLKEAGEEAINLASEAGRREIIEKVKERFERELRQTVYGVERR